MTELEYLSKRVLVNEQALMNIVQILRSTMTSEQEEAMYEMLSTWDKELDEIKSLTATPNPTRNQTNDPH